MDALGFTIQIFDIIAMVALLAWGVDTTWWYLDGCD